MATRNDIRKRRPLIERLLEKVHPEPNSGCWLWLGKLWNGYAVIWSGGGKQHGKFRSAHIVSYELHIGPVPAGLELDHKCRVPCCVNPKHLEPVTHRVNVQRGMAGKYKHAPLTKCRNGHEMTPENTYQRPSRPEGGRECRLCREAGMVRFVAAHLR